MDILLFIVIAMLLFGSSVVGRGSGVMHKNTKGVVKKAPPPPAPTVNKKENLL